MNALAWMRAAGTPLDTIAKVAVGASFVAQPMKGGDPLSALADPMLDRGLYDALIWFRTALQRGNLPRWQRETLKPQIAGYGQQLLDYRAAGVISDKTFNTAVAVLRAVQGGIEALDGSGSMGPTNTPGLDTASPSNYGGQDVRSWGNPGTADYYQRKAVDGDFWKAIRGDTSASQRLAKRARDHNQRFADIQALYHHTVPDGLRKKIAATRNMLDDSDVHTARKMRASSDHFRLLDQIDALPDASVRESLHRYLSD